MRTAIIALALALSACSGGDDTPGVFAPGRAEDAPAADGLLTGHRLMEAGQFELALQAYTRAAGEDGLNVDTLSALGSANLRLGRLGQAERLMRRAVALDPTFAPALNNLGVILMERGEVAEAAETFRRAFATDNGDSDEIRANLRLALARLQDPGYVPTQENPEFQLAPLPSVSQEGIEPL